MNLIDALNSINDTKVNIIRNSGAPLVAEKLYPAFPVMRSLSYHQDIILLINELNTRGLSEHAVTNKMHYEFLLNFVPKKRRFAKWEKPEISDDVKLIMDHLNYSEEKAREILALNILAPEDIENLQNMKQTGGYDGKVKTRKK